MTRGHEAIYINFKAVAEELSKVLLAYAHSSNPFEPKAAFI